jgi:hypothetical protein
MPLGKNNLTRILMQILAYVHIQQRKGNEYIKTPENGLYGRNIYIKKYLINRYHICVVSKELLTTNATIRSSTNSLYHT